MSEEDIVLNSNRKLRTVDSSKIAHLLGKEIFEVKIFGNKSGEKRGEKKVEEREDEGEEYGIELKDGQYYSGLVRDFFLKGIFNFFFRLNILGIVRGRREMRRGGIGRVEEEM
jgi:hypothetical protein